MSTARPDNIYNIPAGIPFAKTLATLLINETAKAPEKLCHYKILLPTRRACRIVRDAFIAQSQNSALLLPKLLSIGDLDEDIIHAASDIPDAIPPLKRQILLSKIIQKIPDYKGKPDIAMNLAADLGHLLDHIYTENLDIKDLQTLVPEDLAEHWQITLEFLKIISEYWPEILKEEGRIDQADRRNRIILKTAQKWNETPPTEPIIIAGTTGSIPATAALLKAVSQLPQGHIFLPGLDHTIDADDWETLEDHHPQWGLKHLLETLDVRIKDVQAIEKEQPRQRLASEIMRPAAQTGKWQDLENQNHALGDALNNLNIVDCETRHDEALLIALHFREILENNNESAVLITPDRTLARHVSTLCKRWNITIDDSAGTPLTQTPIGIFLKLCLQAASDQFSPISLLALLKHPLCKYAEHPTITELDISLRGAKPKAGLGGLKERIENPESPCHPLLTELEDISKDMTTLCHAQEASFAKRLHTHILFAETIGIDDLWDTENGQEAAKFLAHLHEHTGLIEDVGTHHYQEILDSMMRTLITRKTYGTHPQLHILGQLEARLVNADLVVLGGLNEGTWPAQPAHDPWMSRAMKNQFGLPAAERSIGLAAHDFVQGFCAPRVLMTRAKKVDNAPTMPARWLQRLETVLHAAKIKPDILSRNTIARWSQKLDQSDASTPITRPSPRPPAPLRPTQLSVTKIETWLKDPYTIYARYILNLKNIKQLEDNEDNALRGSVLHKILERFVSERLIGQKITDIHPSKTTLYTIAKEVLEPHKDDPNLSEFYWPRLRRIMDWFVQTQLHWQDQFVPLKIESHGHLALGNFTLSGIADRIDVNENTAAIIDYKSGGTFSKTDIEEGKNPQLALEALMLSKGTFDNTTLTPHSLSYWVMSGGKDPGKITEVKTDIDTIIENTYTGLKTLIETFADENTPYLSVPNPENMPRFNDYEHLARIKEWNIAATDDSEAA